MTSPGYKLRLGDGTTFAVDEKGLQTWLQGQLVDQNARIQPAGSNKWFTIRQLRALEREAAEHAAFEQRAIAREVKAAERAAADMKVAEQAEAERQAAEKAEAERRAVGEKAEVERRVGEKAQTDRAAADAELARQIAAEQAEASRQVAEEIARTQRQGEEARAARDREAEEKRAARARQIEEERAAEERRVADRRAAELRREAERRAAEEKAVAARRATEEAERRAAEERAERARQAEEARAVEERWLAERRAAEEAERRAAERLAAEQAERRAAERRAAEEAERRGAERRAVEEAERVAAERRAAEEVERQLAEERALALSWAAEERAKAERRAEEERAARERQRREEARPPAQEPLEWLHGDVEVGFEPRATEVDLEPFAMEVEEPRVPRPAELGIIPLAPIDATPAAARATTSAPPLPDTWADPMDDDDALFHKPAAPAAFEAKISAVFDRVSPIVLWCEEWIQALAHWASPRARRLAATSQPMAASVWGRLRSAVARRRNRGERISLGLTDAPPATASSVSTSAPAAARSTPLSPTSAPSALREGPAKLAAAVQQRWQQAQAWVGGQMATLRMGRSARTGDARVREAPSSVEPGPAFQSSYEPSPWSEPAAPPIRTSVPEKPMAPAKAPATARAPLPPPPLADLPVIRLADTGDLPAPAGTAEAWLGSVFESARESRAAYFAANVWRWLKVASVLAALALVAVLLTSSRDVWLPHAKVAAVRLGTQMDEVKARMATVSPEAINAASQELPHLRLDTVELIMSSSAPRVLEPAEVFRQAHQSAARGRARLPPAAVTELDVLTAALLEQLPESDAERLRSYFDRLRLRDATASYEDKEAVWLAAHAARRLAPGPLTRLQARLAEAVSLGFERPATPPPPVQAADPLP